MATYSRAVAGECSPSDLETALQMMHLLFTCQLRPERENLASLLRMLREQIENQWRDPHARFANKARPRPPPAANALRPSARPSSRKRRTPGSAPAPAPGSAPASTTAGADALKVLRTALKQVTELNTGNVPFFRAAGTRDLDRLDPHLACAPPPY